MQEPERKNLRTPIHALTMNTQTPRDTARCGTHAYANIPTVFQAPLWMLVDIRVIFFLFFFLPPADADGLLPSATACASSSLSRSSNLSSQPCNHPSFEGPLDWEGPGGGDAGGTAIVPHTVRGPDGLVDGEATAPKRDCLLEGHGGDAVEEPASPAGVSTPATLLDSG